MNRSRHKTPDKTSMLCAAYCLSCFNPHHTRIHQSSLGVLKQICQEAGEEIDDIAAHAE